MSLIQRIKAVLGLNGSATVEEDGPVAVTVEHQPSEPEDIEPEPASPSEPEWEHAGPVTEISGIGPSYSERLAAAGVETVGDLAAAEPTALAAETGVSEKRIQTWVDAAQDLAV